jgi:hypothetical protein
MKMTRTFLVVSILLTSGPLAVGCQYVAGIAGLEATLSETEPEMCSPESCAPFACSDAGNACTTSCTPTEGCANGTICITPPGTSGFCATCGWTPPPGMCMTCESCNADLCTTKCDQPGECTQNRTLEPMMGVRQRLECNDQCNDITITCMGPSPCEVVCSSGGCQNLQLKCDPVGLCNLVCNGSSCVGATMVCGLNACTATCDSGASVDQQCGSACECSKPGCQ